MELTHLVHFAATPRGFVDGRAQFISVWDARSYPQRQLAEQIPQLLRELELGKVSHFDPTPWLRAILLVCPQPSDALALSVMDRGVLILEAPPESPTTQIIEQFLDQAAQLGDLAAIRGRTDPLPLSSPPSGPEHATAPSEFSRTPPYFDRARYDEWLARLSQPWRIEDTFDSES